MEEEEEDHNAVYGGTEIAADEVEAKDTTTLARAAELRKDCAMLLAPSW